MAAIIAAFEGSRSEAGGAEGMLGYSGVDIAAGLNKLLGKETNETIGTCHY